MLRQLINYGLDSSNKPNTAKIKSVMTDGDYDNNIDFRYLEKMFKLRIKISINSVVSIRNNRLRKKTV